MRRTALKPVLCGGITGATGLALGFVLALAAPALARPLDAEACAKLKTQRDALAASGTREAFKQAPPARRLRVLEEPAQRMRTLIELDGQLRFRCRIDLPIQTLRPELLAETPDSVDGEPAPKVANVTAARQKAVAARKAALAAEKTGATAAGPGTPVPVKRKTATVKPDSSAPATTGSVAADPPVKPRPKPAVKSEDSYHAPSKADVPAGDGSAAKKQ